MIGLYTIQITSSTKEAPPTKRTKCFSDDVPTSSCDRDNDVPALSCDRDNDVPTSSCDRDNDVPALSCDRDNDIPSTEASKGSKLGKLSRFRISKQTRKTLKERGVRSLFPIQYLSFDHVYDGKDLIGQASKLKG